MIFLNSAVLFGLFAASIPIIIHLLNLRKLKKIEFSTLTFLKELQKNKIRKIKIKQWLLLALRVSIILLLVFAFARPTLEGIAIGGTTSAAKTSAVFIIDNTFSMSVVDGNGSYLNQAKETLKDLLNQLQEGDDAVLVLTSDTGNEKKLSNNLSDIHKQAENINISGKKGYLHNAVVKAAKILSGSNNFNKEIYILSDFQSTGLAEDQSFSDLSELLNDKIKMYTFNYSGKDVFNTGIDGLELNTQIFEKDKPVSFNLTVTNYSKETAGRLENGVVSLYINGERSAQQSVTLGAGESAVLDIEAAVKNAGYVDVFAELEDDEILMDNRHYVSFYVPEEIPAAIFTDIPGDAKFLELALTATNTENTLKISTRNITQLPSVNLSQFDVLIIAGTEKIPNFDALKSFVENGGGLFLMPGSGSSNLNFNNFLTSLNLPPSLGESGKADNPENIMSFQSTEFNHPVFQNIFSNNEKKGIESPEIYKYFRLNTGGKGISIIDLADDSPFLCEYKSGKGKIFVMASAPVLEWSSLPLKSIFAPLVNKAVFYLASKDAPKEDYIAGSEVNIKLSNLSLPQLRIIRPDKSEEFINIEGRTDNYVSYNNTDLTGNYTVYSGDKIADNFSINTYTGESEVEYVEPEEFESYLDKINFKGTFIAVGKNENPANIILQARFGSELWKLFLIIALILAFVEMAIARNAKKELVQVSA